jgi:hypothetical protein
MYDLYIYIAIVIAFFLLGFIIGYIQNPRRKLRKQAEMPLSDTAKHPKEMRNLGQEENSLDQPPNRGSYAKDQREIRDQRDLRDSRDLRDQRDFRDQRDLRDQRDQRDRYNNYYNNYPENSNQNSYRQPPLR